jgi:hypothetical protein
LIVTVAGGCSDVAANNDNAKNKGRRDKRIRGMPWLLSDADSYADGIIALGVG